MGLAACRPAAGAERASPLLKAMKTELERSFAGLAHADSVPLYYLSYEATDTDYHELSASYGAIQRDAADRSRVLDIDCRVGDRALDNTHEMRGEFDLGGADASTGQLPLGDDDLAVRAIMWKQTDDAYKAALERYTKVKTNQQVLVVREDTSADFSTDKPGVDIGPTAAARWDADAWRPRLRKWSSAFKAYPFVEVSAVRLTLTNDNRFFVDSDGARLQTGQAYARLAISCSGRCEDGMEINRIATFDAAAIEGLPAGAEVDSTIDRLAGELRALLHAPLAEPYAGPAILINRASGVFFHEIFGHRIEGHRQKSETEGQTFARKVGQQILPVFISVYDDPTLAEFGGTFLRGHYLYDDQGVKAKRVPVVENGVLRNFLMSRSPINGFPESNGHGRRQPGNPVVARQGNLLVTSTRQFSLDTLKAMLLEECRKQGKPYGLVFYDIAGGETNTGRYGPQSFKVEPLLVYRYYADGRPPEAIRGVDIVGTPLSSFETIVATGDDYGVFDGTCGAESGWVPVSAISPSILVDQVEIERRAKEQDRPPVLAPPYVPRGATGGEEVIFRSMQDELKRNLDSLVMEDLERPYFLSYTMDDAQDLNVHGVLGTLLHSRLDRSRYLTVELRVGTDSLDNTNFITGYGGRGPNFTRVALDDDYDALRNRTYLATDDAYKAALKVLSKKRAYLKTTTVEDRPKDFLSQPVSDYVGALEAFDIDEANFDALVEAASGVFRDYPKILSSEVYLAAAVANQYFVSSEGAKSRRGDRIYVLRLAMSGKSDAGEDLSDGDRIVARRLEDLPGREEAVRWARENAERMMGMLSAGVVEEYTGPVLLTGDAPGEFFRQLFIRNISDAPAPLTDSDRGTQGGPEFVNKLHRRVLPEFLSVYDDPSIDRLDGLRLVGSFAVDDAGEVPKRVALVDSGRLVGLPIGEAPTKRISEPNGHARGAVSKMVQARPSNVVFASRDTVPETQLRHDLLDMCRDVDLEYGLVVRRLDDVGGSFGVGASAGRGSSDGGLTSPLEVSKVYLDGREEPVRNLEFSDVTVRALRDITETGAEDRVYNYLIGDDYEMPVSIVSPSILIEEMELKKSETKIKQPPVLPSPLLRK
jgi:predicted Zn-dependent protease